MMDRPTIRKDAETRMMRLDLPAEFLPPTREAVLDLGRAALHSGPILLTGDAGIGKSWVVARLVQDAAATRWMTIDLTPSDGPADLYQHIAHGLGIGTVGPFGPSRLDIADALAERANDGESHALVIDEAHNLSPLVWEEVRVLTNRLGQPKGFRHLILIGQTPLVRRFATRPLASVAARLAAHIHLRPIEVAEAAEWFQSSHPGLELASEELERVHRDAGGNPGRLLRHFAALRPRIGSKTAINPPGDRPQLPTDGGDDAPAEVNPAAAIVPNPSTARSQAGSPRPPLHVADDSIEVGWSAEDGESVGGVEDGEAATAPLRSADSPPRSEESDQAVHDHYAALQAWREWAHNQEKRANPLRSDRDLADSIDEAAAAEAADAADPSGHDRGSIRAEGHQHFAPFGQLFTRMAQFREPESPRS